MLIIGITGAQLTADERRLLDDPLCVGVILFRRNVVDLEQVRALCAEIHAHRDNLLVCIDQEGGPVRRLREGVTDIGPMRDIASADAAYRAGRTLGAELAALGIDVNFAPVLDVDSNPDNPIIGPRSFSRDPAEVARRGVALHRGLTDAGVISCGKHFPGHGDTDLDSHLDLPVLDFDRERLDRVELPPFVAAVAEHIPMLMTAHIALPKLDPEWPATLSPVVIAGLLRDEMGYDGVVVSDDLEMNAVADRYDIPTMVRQGVHAGLDLFLVCHDLDKQRAALETLRALPEERTRLSMNRIDALRANFSTNH